MQVSSTLEKRSFPASSFIARVTQPIRHAATAIKDRIFNAIDYVLPINPLTQERQFTLIPLRAEFFLGASLFAGKDIKPSDDSAKTERIHTIFQRLADQAPCYEGYTWPFEVRLCDRKELNAYCLPGGKMVFFKGLVEAIDAHFSNVDRPALLTLTLEDGSEVTIDTKDVTADDVLAAVMGHEMTHGIARHGAFKLLFSLSIEITSAISSFTLGLIANTLGRAKVKAPSEEELRNKRREEVVKPATIQHNLLGKVCLVAKVILDNRFVHNLAGFLIKNAHSRKSELQADKHGIELMVKAGYNAKGALVLHQILSKGHHHQASRLERVAEFFSSHPIASTRLAANYQTIQQLQV